MFVDDYARTQVWETRAAEVSRVPGTARSLPRTDRPSQLHAKGSGLATALRPGGPGPCFQEFLRADNGFHVGCFAENQHRKTSAHVKTSAARIGRARTMPSVRVRAGGQTLPPTRGRARGDAVRLSVTSRVGTRQLGGHPEGQAGVREATQGGGPRGGGH